MTVTAAIRRMLDAGLTIEQALTAAQAFEESMPAPQPERSKAALRQERYRRNKASQNVTSVTETDLSSPSGSSPRPLSPNPLQSIPPSPPKGGSSPTAQQPKIEFESHFWPIYPHKVGKPVALTAFVKARHRADLETIIAGLMAYVAKTDDRPWCNPSTWLNQDRWNDRPAQVARGQPPPRAPDLSDLFTENAQKLMDEEHDRWAFEGSDKHRDFDSAGQALPRLAAPPR